MNLLVSDRDRIISHLSKDDILKNIISSNEFPVLRSSNNLFHDLMSCIIEQQIHHRSTKKIYAKVLSNAKLSELTPDNFKILEKNNFEGATLSISKFETMQSVLNLFKSDVTDWNNLSNDEIHNKLGTIKGVGRKTINLLLIYSLAREDIFIEDDYHIQKIMINLFDLDNSSRVTAQIKEITSEWAPYRSYAFLTLLQTKNRTKNSN